MLILHGLFGQSRNWTTMATTINRRLSLPTICMDLRNHGHSPRHPSMTWEDAVVDISESVPAPLKQAHLIGHSMGGKVAIEVALRKKCRSVTVVDIAPKPYPNMDKMLALCHAMQTINKMEFTEYKQVQEQMMTSVGNLAIVQFLMTNLKRNADGKAYFDLPLDVFVEFMTSQSGRPFPTIDPKQPLDIPCLVIRGAKSDYVLDEDLMIFQRLFNMVQMDTIADAGHWVHSQKPDQFCDSVCKFIMSNS